MAALGILEIPPIWLALGMAAVIIAQALRSKKRERTDGPTSGDGPSFSGF